MLDKQVTMQECASPSPELERLFDQAETTYYEFGSAWLKHLASTALTAAESCRFCFSGTPTRPKVILPLIARRQQRELASLSSWYSSLYAPTLDQNADLDDFTPIFQHLATEPDGWRQLRLSPMDPDDPLFALTRKALRKAGWFAFPFYIFGNWYLPVQGRNYTTYAESLPSQLRNTLKRKTVRFLQEGEGRLEMVTGGARLEEAIQDWTRIYHASWKSPEPFPEFVPGLIRLCAAKGWLRLGLAYYRGLPVAGQIWIVNHGRAAIYKLAHDKRLERYSPGTLLTAFLMRQALDEDKVSEVDYLIGDEPYKQDWMSHRRERWGIIAYNPRTLAGLLGAGKQAGWHAVKRVLSMLGLKSPGYVEPDASGPQLPQ